MKKCDLTKYFLSKTVNKVVEKPNMAKDINSEFIKKESKTEFDAIHPRFQPESEAEVQKYQQEHYFYCQQCNTFFAPTVTALKVHFRGDMVVHIPSGSCFYCRGEVFEYNLNNRRKIYHSCWRKS